MISKKLIANLQKKTATDNQSVAMSKHPSDKAVKANSPTADSNLPANVLVRKTRMSVALSCGVSL